MGLPLVEVQTAMIALYRGDSTLQGLLGNPINPPAGVYDSGAVQTGRAFPYVVVTIPTTQLGTLMTMALDGADLYPHVSVFTQAGGFAQARGIAEQIYKLTHRTMLSLANGFSNVLTLFDNGQEMISGEESVQQITHRYKLMTQG